MRAIVFFGLVALAVAAPQGQEPIPIVSQSSDINPDGSYQWSFESGNGIKAQESGSLKDIGAEEPALQVQGDFSYPGDDGQVIQLTYIANENGYQPQGSHIPTPHPIPAAIQRSLDFLATAPPQTEKRR